MSERFTPELTENRHRREKDALRKEQVFKRWCSKCGGKMFGRVCKACKSTPDFCDCKKVQKLL